MFCRKKTLKAREDLHYNSDQSLLSFHCLQMLSYVHMLKMSMCVCLSVCACLCLCVCVRTFVFVLLSVIRIGWFMISAVLHHAV